MNKAGKAFALNREQEKVVNHRDGPLLVVAGAGTGKTRVIVEHINKLLNDGIEPERILALTFTEKAAAEMLDRVLEGRGMYELELPILTFNSFGESLLRRFSSDIGLGRRFLLLGENAQIVFLRERIDDLDLDYFAPVSRPDALLDDIAKFFSKLKQNVITPKSYHDFVRKMPENDDAEKLEKTKHSELAHAYEKYLLLCREANVIDYDDQIYLVIDLLTKRPNVRKELSENYHTIMIDEFQDTNPMQSRLVDMLVDKQKSLIVVGDDDQSIYGFRGATLSNILEFKNRYPEAKEIALVKNYRSGQAILDAAYELIQNNNPHRLEARLGINKKLISNKEGVAPNLLRFSSIDEELHWIAHDIQKKIDTGTDPGSIAVLTRRNTTARLIDEALEYAHVPHVVVGQKYNLYQDTAVRMLLETLRTITDPVHSLSLYHTLISPLFRIEPSLLTHLNALARRQNTTLDQEVKNSDDESLDGAKAALEMIEQWRTDMTLLSVGQLVYKVISDSGYKDILYREALNDPIAGAAIGRLSQFFRTLKEFESIAVQPSALQYVESLPALEAAGETGEDDTLDLSSRLVNVLTIHKAKGLEWDTVYIADCTEGSFPLRAGPKGIVIPQGLADSISSEADEHIAEERRLMYVAATRARNELHLTYSDRHHTPTPRKPSRFLREMFGVEIMDGKLIEPENATLNLDAYGEKTSAVIDTPIPSSILSPEGIVNLSVSQAVTFLRCPLDFYYCYVLEVPEEPNASLEYGKVLHSMIERINKGLHDNNPPSILELLAELESSWPRAGYLSNKQRSRSLEQAKKTLENFYARHISENSICPQYVEAPFSFTMKNEKISVRGRFDVVFEKDGITEIRDYKTGNGVDSHLKAKARASSSDQLTLYALAWQSMHDELPGLLTLEFVDSGFEGSIKKTSRGIETMKTKLASIADAIRKHEFKEGSSHEFCRHPLSHTGH